MIWYSLENQILGRHNRLLCKKKSQTLIRIFIIYQVTSEVEGGLNQLDLFGVKSVAESKSVGTLKIGKSHPSFGVSQFED